MNDRYLYRAKRTDNGEWVEGNLVWSDDADDDYKAIIIPVTWSNMFTTGGENVDLGFEKWYRVNPSTICQCTGLKDKHGKLIYENDILVAHLDDEFPDNETYMQVIWKNSGLFLKHSGCDFCEQLDEFIEKHFEVIGNIFDNAELLEVGE